MANKIFVYWSDGLGAGHLAFIAGTGGGAFANKNCPYSAGHLTKFFKCPGFVQVFARGGGGDARVWN